MNVSLGEIDDDVIDWRFKGFPALSPGTTVSAFVAARPSLFTAGFSWPVMALRASALDNNIGVLARLCAASGISHAPHGKTTMMPGLFARQLQAGAWAMTAATPWQARAYSEFGVNRVLLANELTDASFARWLVDRLADPNFDFYCYVDCVAGVELLGAATSGASRPVNLLLELGLPGGRTGVRDDGEARAVARAVGRFASLSLAGVAGYEGPLGHERDDATKAGVRRFVTRLADMLCSLDATGLLDPRRDEYVLSCGGSGHVDVVTDVLTAPLACARPVRPVLRAGSYVTHDNGLYARTSSLADALIPAIEIWCQVLSRPEPALALLGAGRRDVPFDAGLPVPLLRRDATGELMPLDASVRALNDQHLYLDIETASPLEVGDLVCFGISHPCTAHDKWQLAPLLDDDRRVVDCLRSYF